MSLPLSGLSSPALAAASTPYAARPPSLSMFGGSGGGELNEAAVADFLLQKKYHLTALELHQEVRPRARDAAAAAAAAFPACGAAPRLSNAPCFVLLRRASVCSC